MRDWHAWHQEYDDPASSLSRRLEVVRHQVGRALSWLETEGVAHPRVVSMCAGDGRDLLPVLAGGHPTATATLVELDPELAARARADAEALGLTGVDVRTSDAGETGSYRGAVPADLLMACGVFGNVAEGDVGATVAVLPRLLAPNAIVVWTRGGPASEEVRTSFLAGDFCEVAFVRPDDATYRVGVARFTGAPQPFDPGLRMFRFA